MGAAASIKQIYADGITWFKKYFEEGLYLEDFKSIDKDDSGGISYIELEKWIRSKAVTGGSWSFMISNAIIIKMAHAQAVRHSTADRTHIVNQKDVGFNDFRNLLIHLFAISILWVHFKNADDWVEGYDFGNLSLSFEEFKLACRSVSASYANEPLADEQIEQDFSLLDLNKNGSLAFIEVCEYCCKFIHNEFEMKLEETRVSSKRGSIHISVKNGTNDCTIDPLLLGNSERRVSAEPTFEDKEDLMHSSSEKKSSSRSIQSEKISKAMDAMSAEIQKNQSVADFVEIKVSTENQMNAIFNQ
eukprot:gene2880-3064_t